MNRRKTAWSAGLAVVLAVTGAAALPAVPASAAGTGAAAKLHDDFNGDGYADLAVTAPSATVSGHKGAGYVAVLYGSASGLKTSTKQVFSQNSAGVPGSAEAGDRFGSAVTTADLDRDGYADLIVGAGGEDTTAGTDAGSVVVLWGGKQGLSGGATLGGGAAYDGLGDRGHLTAGDVNGDGAPDVVTVVNAHDLRVQSGPFSRGGSPAHGTQLVKDEFDSRYLDLAAGDLNGDGVTDVAATANDGDEWDARRVVYWTGTHDGLAPYKVVRGNEPAGRLEGGEHLAIGDVNRDGFADVVVGRALEGADSDVDTPLARGGRIAWIPGTANGPDGTKAVIMNLDTPGVPGTAKPGSGFGTGVSVADIDGDHYADVAVGTPSVSGGGQVIVLRGTAKGPTGTGAKAFGQDTAGVPGAGETGDAFGAAVRLVDANRDGRAELAVGAPGENARAGSVWVLRGTASGLTATGSFTFASGTLGTVAEGGQLGSGFGS
ncbi:FG-GAP-like repeat-containing protein [Streptomyces naphthomycinicus]|uniref:FG-GAP-like repeat-containing protein n=1 Tax=Streptomyces naphthomycinicus TaxID=2872625 RepID=UPI001CEDA563|nr:FG-GAP-like repeat-containing protein [Streptomyces sp. TML10]